MGSWCQVSVPRFDGYVLLHLVTANVTLLDHYNSSSCLDKWVNSKPSLMLYISKKYHFCFHSPDWPCTLWHRQLVIVNVILLDTYINLHAKIKQILGLLYIGRIWYVYSRPIADLALPGDHTEGWEGHPTGVCGYLQPPCQRPLA